MFKLQLPTLVLSKWHLHAIHAFSLVLTLLFLVLPGITGSATKLWWMTVTYPVPGATGDALGVGSGWKMGALGVCKVGDECSRGTKAEFAPAVSGSIKSALIYHLAVAGILFVIAILEIVLVHRSGMSTWRAWTTFFLPIFGSSLVISVMSVDLIIRSRLVADEGIEKVKTEAVFWLSVVAVFTSLIWAAAVYRLRQARLDGNASELREVKERKVAADRKAAKEGRRRDALVPDKNWVERLTSWR